MTDQSEVLSTAGDQKAEADTAHGAFASDWVLSPEIASRAGLDHTRRVRAGGPP